ncbi:hypothetical protein GCM10017687_59750 [Streptomyces echinatus]
MLGQSGQLPGAVHDPARETRGIDDPAELVAAGFRLTARMADSHPELMRILRDRGLAHIHSERGLSPPPSAS